MKFKNVAITLLAALNLGPSQGVGLESQRYDEITSMSKNRSKRVELSIITERTEFRSESPIKLTLRVTNLSKRSIIVVATVPERDYKVVVKDESDRIVSVKAEWTPQFRLPTRREQVRLNSGESLQEVIELTELYDLRRPGRYTVSVSRAITIMPQKRLEKITSDTLAIRVVE